LSKDFLKSRDKSKPLLSNASNMKSVIEIGT
jgi:hypothetical protein